MPSLLVLFSLLAVSATTLAQMAGVTDPCSDGGGCGYLSVGSDPDGCGVDPLDGTTLGVLAAYCVCDGYQIQDLAVTYTGTDGGVTTEYSTTTLQPANSVPTTITYSFTGYNTAIESGSPVSLSFAVFEDGAFYSYGLTQYPYSPVTSIFFTASTTTITTIDASSTTTVTTTITSTSTSSIPQQTTSTPCTTDTATVTGGTSTVSMTSTVTVTAKTKTIRDILIVHTTAKCIASPAPTAKAQRRDNLMQRRNEQLQVRQTVIDPGQVEIDWCPAYYGPPSSTYYTTSTSVVYANSTETYTATAVAMTTVTDTEYPTPATTTLCTDVEATSTTTPTSTSTIYSVYRPSRSTITTTTTFTLTNNPHHATLCSAPTRANPSFIKEPVKWKPPVPSK